MGKPLQLKAASVLPWGVAKSEIPDNFELGSDGVYTVKENTRQKISGPAWVSAFTRDSQGGSWGVVAHWVDQDGREHQQAFSREILHERGTPLAMALASRGLVILPGREKTLTQYFGTFDPAKRLEAVCRLGWLAGDALVYVLPKKVIGSCETEVVFQPEQFSPTTETLATKGMLSDWQKLVAQPCQGNPLLVFCLCAAFAGTLTKFADSDSGGFHLFGNSSKGKTTALQVAASVWGCGADPASENSFIRRWNATGNALEGVAAAHNDGLLVLDELGTCDSQDFGKVIYNLFGGQGKSRMSQDAMLKEQRTWRVLTLSTGEVSAEQKIEEGTRRLAKHGQLARLIDLPIRDGVIAETHGIAAAEFVDRFKKHCGRVYGVAGPEFIEQLILLEGDAQTIRATVHKRIDTWNDEVRTPDLNSVQQRVLKRFALVAAAGSLAVEFGILPFNRHEVNAALKEVWTLWRQDAESIDDAARGVVLVREFILRNPMRFRRIDDESIEVRDLAGYRNDEMHFFTVSGFKEACAGCDANGTLRELFARDLLRRSESDRYKTKTQVAGIGRLALYGIKKTILENEVK